MPSIDQEFFKKNQYIKIKPYKKQDFFDLYSFKGTVSEKLRDKKDAGALKASREYLKNNYETYSQLLIDNRYLKSIEEGLKLKLFPYKLMHVISDDQTNSLIWHRDVYKHNNKNIGPPWPLFKLAIYLQKTNKSNGITGFIPGKLNLDINNRYLDTLYAFLVSKFAYYACVEAGESILFSGKVMHQRPLSNSKNHRQAIIFSLTTSHETVKEYMKDINSFPYYLKKIKKL